jgi:hypothetical protein
VDDRIKSGHDGLEWNGLLHPHSRLRLTRRWYNLPLLALTRRNPEIFKGN